MTSRIAYHLYFWFFFFCFFVLTSDGKGANYATRVSSALRYLGVFVLPVYFHFFILEKYFYKKKYGIYAGLFLAMLFGYGYLVHIFFFRGIYEKSNLISSIMILFLMLLMSTSIKVLADSIKQRFLLQQIEAKQVQTELSLLKTQINPHFLFNTLNNLFGMARKQDKETADGIAGLSHLMRYMIYESNVDKIVLEKEIRQIKRLIELQKLRFSADDDIRVDFQVEGNVENVKIPPMLLIPFVENAFKHGISLKRSSFIRIRLSVKDKELQFSVHNSRHLKPGEKEEPGLGVGLKNVKRRLELLYPEIHELTIRDSQKEFEVNLTLKEVLSEANHEMPRY